MGQIYYDMGFLSSTEVIECSASDLVGQYVGQTGPKTVKLLEKALGRVLFIDEAYRLSEGQFAKEAMDELVGLLTQERFRAKFIVILAGYDREMNELMAVNTGLSSRFPEEVIFKNIPPVQCLEILKRKLREQTIRLDALDDSSSTEYVRLVDMLEELSLLPSWGNARDLETLSKQMMTVVFASPSDVTASHSKDFLTLAGKDAVACVEMMLTGRRERTSEVPTRSHRGHEMLQMLHERLAPTLPTIRTTRTINESPPPPPQAEMKRDVPPESDGRDAGVADQIWHQLQIDKQATEDAAKRSQEAMRLVQQQIQDARKREESAAADTKRLGDAKMKDTAELMRLREAARLRELAARQEHAKRVAALKLAESKQREEARIQTKLRQLGVCSMGYRWIKQASGYRCAGGSHSIDNASLGI